MAGYRAVAGYRGLAGYRGQHIFIQDCRKVKNYLSKATFLQKERERDRIKSVWFLRTHMSRSLKFQVLSQLRLEFRKSVYRM